MPKPSDNMVKEDHPYDHGYWARYDGEPIPKGKGTGEQQKGWRQCDRELREEAETVRVVAKDNA